MEHRWAKGKSGNPRGRPRKPREEGFADLLRKHLEKMVPITTDGRPQRVSMLEAASAMLVNDLFKGSPADRLRTLGFLLKNNLINEVAKPQALRDGALREFVNQLAEEARRDEECGSEWVPPGGSASSD